MDEVNENTLGDAFHGAQYNMVQFVQLSRIYDVLMTIVQLQDPTAAENLLGAHGQGKLVNPSPQYTGEFMWDTLNIENRPQDNE